MRKIRKFSEPPDRIFHDDTDDVDQPQEREADKQQNNAENNTEHVVVAYALDDTVDHPEDIERGDREDQLDDLREIVKRFDEFLNINSGTLLLIIGKYTISQRNGGVKGFPRFFIGF